MIASVVPQRTIQSRIVTRPTASMHKTGSPGPRARWRRRDTRSASDRGSAADRRGRARRVAWGQEVDEQTIRARDAGGELAEEDQAGVHEAALAVTGDQRRAEERLLVRVARREERLVARIPLAREVDAALLHPAVEVLGPDLVR